MNSLKLLIYKLSGGFSLLRFQFTINIANPCNRRCNFCPNHAPGIIPDWYQHWWKAQPDFMDADKFADFLKRMGVLRWFIRQLSFTGRGETLLHPDLLKFCSVAERYGIRFHITTNGDRLTRELESELAKFKHLHYVRVSVFDPERAEYWLKRQAKSPIRIHLQNVTQYHLKGYEDGFLSINNPGTKQYCTMPEDFMDAKYCTAPFSFNTLNTDGSLVTCITFFEVGNVFEHPFWKIWNGKKMRLIRRQALSMSIPRKFADCRNCGNFFRFEKYAKMNQLKEWK